MKKVKIVSFIAVWLIAGLCHADWQLNPEQSQLSFVTTKAQHVAEVHQFSQLSGQVSDGQAKLIVDLSSVDTKIDIRNERLKEMLFETGMYPTATISLEAPKALLALKVGEQQKHTLAGNLTLHGKSKTLMSDASISRLGSGDLIVNSTSPIIIQGSDFDLVAGIEKLREVAGLDSISYSVAVTYSLTFVEQ